jgi:hypothetical protein
MTTIAYPTIGQWFRRPNGVLLEVVAVDEGDDTIEVQFFDGTIDEIDIEAWREQLLVEVSAPEDWSGSVDMDPEDYKGTGKDEMPQGFHDPLGFLGKDS